jgi:hypothetical protein
LTRWYETYGIRLRSEIDLSFAECVPAGKPDVDLLGESERFFRDASRDAVLRPAECRWYEYALLEDDQIYLKWKGEFEFLVTGDGRRIFFRKLDAGSLESLRFYLLGRALSFAMVRQGYEPIHSSTVVLDGHALAFLGESGFGKSSLAAEFLSAGCRLLTDDLLLVSQRSGRLEAQPGPPRIKLFPWVARQCLGPDAAGVPMNMWSDKLVVPLGEDRHSSRPVPLSSFYILRSPHEIGREQGIRIDDVSRRDAFVEMIRYTFNDDLADGDRLKRLFSKSLELAAQVPVKRISYPRELPLLPEVRKQIMADFAVGAQVNDQKTSVGASERDPS